MIFRLTFPKHGKGVSVSAKENPQLMLYALGALKFYQPILGGNIKKVELCIDQPRLDIYESWQCSIDDLLAWVESIKAKAQANRQISALDDFADAVNQSPALLSPEETAVLLKKGETLSA